MTTMLRAVASRVRAPARSLRIRPAMQVRAFSKITFGKATTSSRGAVTQGVSREWSANHAAVRFYSSSLPDHQELGMPALSPTMTEGNIAEWKVAIGDKINPGDAICDIETDKATVSMDAQDEGYVAKILVPQGAQGVAVGTPIIVLTDEAEDVGQFENYEPSVSGSSEPAAPAPPTAAPTPAAPSAPRSLPTVAPREGDRIFVSPRARVAANERGIDLKKVVGTGPNRRVVYADILEYKEAPAEAAVTTQATAEKKTAELPDEEGDFVDIPTTQIRKVIAQRLVESKQEIPHYYVTMECQMDELMRVRGELNADSNGEYKLSVNDFVIKAAASALREVPECNSSWRDTYIRQYNNVDVSVAVQTDNGLLTPIVFNAHQKGLAGISQDVKSLAAKAKENKLQPEEFIGGTFTISNLGMYGVKQFTAIINPPQACILAVGAADKKVVVQQGEDGSQEFKQVNVMNVTLSSDHRVVDGAIAAQYLQQFKKYIENPLKLML